MRYIFLFTDEIIKQLRYERYHHPHPLVQRKMEALLLKSQGLTHKQIGHIVGVCQFTLRSYFEQYKHGGIEALKKLNYYCRTSELEQHESTIEEEFTKNPPATLKEAAARINELTGIARSTVQVSKFLKKKGITRRKTAPIPAKADPQKQQIFVDQELNPRLEEAKQGKRQVLFVDASHFVLMAFLGYLWSLTRIFLKSPSGRQRYNVLGAFNAITHELITVTNTTYINALSVIELINKVCEKHTDSCITLVMDNARYQKCKAVMDLAEKKGVELLFLPSYSPNLNLIERLWKFVKKECLYNKYHETFVDFMHTIDQCLNNISGKHKKEIDSLMTLNFQLFENVS